MCGFAGFHGMPNVSKTMVITALERMGEAIRHRGPDDAGIWQEKELQAGLVHRRLSVLDLSLSGHQPMISTSERYVIAFNGEIYNHKALRTDLEQLGVEFRGHSDTEVLLSAFDAWGFESTLNCCNGMFALALWDNKTRKLYLARDRLGEKPLYYSRLGQTTLFSSELKALHEWPGFAGQVDPCALNLFLRLGYVPGELSIFQDTRKVPPGAYVILDETGISEPVKYWDLKDIIAYTWTSPFQGSEQEALAELDAILRDAVSVRMGADVSLGAFLSGGVDSTLVTALMQVQSDRPISTFTVGFHEPRFNEASHAKSVAAHLGTCHTELCLDCSVALDTVSFLPELFDEPFADESQIPTYLVAQMARNHVKVALSGDGGDEVFAGYNRYIVGRHLWRQVSWLPYMIRGNLAALSEWGSRSFGGKLLDGVNALLSTKVTRQQFDKIMRLVGARDSKDVYWRLISTWLMPPLSSNILSSVSVSEEAWREHLNSHGLSDIAEMMMAADLLSYLPDDILVKLDRASMGVGLEGRIPLLDHRVVEFGWSLPLDMKLRDGRGKWLLRQLLYRYVPQELVDRPKMGFSVPLAEWLRNPLRDWAEDLLSEQSLKMHGLLDIPKVQLAWKQHLSKRWDRSHELWNVLMFQAWYGRWMVRN